MWNRCHIAMYMTTELNNKIHLNQPVTSNHHNPAADCSWWWELAKIFREHQRGSGQSHNPLNCIASWYFFPHSCAHLPEISSIYTHCGINVDHVLVYPVVTLATIAECDCIWDSHKLGSFFSGNFGKRRINLAVKSYPPRRDSNTRMYATHAFLLRVVY